MASAAIVAASESEWIFPLSEYLSHDKTSRQSGIFCWMHSFKTLVCVVFTFTTCLNTHSTNASCALNR